MPLAEDLGRVPFSEKKPALKVRCVGRHDYPRVDVVQALRGMKGWFIGNPARRKTRRGIKAFITNWLAREQDKPSGGVAGGSCGTVAGAEAGAGRRLPLLSKAVDFVSRHVAAGEDAAAMVELFCEHNRLDAAEYLPAVEAAVQAQMRG